MINLILFGSFFVLLFLNVPICVSLGMSSIFAMLFSGDKLSVVPTNVYSSMAKFLLLAIPFFVLSGNIMAKAGISTRLVQFIDDCIGHRRGGIAIVCVVVACFFGAISGSGPATVAALGIILIPAMINRGGFSAAFSSAMMATASSIAIVIPPSIAFVVYASITGVSVGDMFMGGILPGIMMGLALVIIIMIEVRRKGLPPSREKATTPSVMWRKRVSSLFRSFSTAARVVWSTPAISLKVPVRMPISSVDSTGRALPKSPAATRSAPAVSFSMGPTMVLDSRKDSSHWSSGKAQLTSRWPSGSWVICFGWK